MDNYRPLTCQWIGPEQDPRKGPVHYCGKPNLTAKSYCADHFYKVYQGGTSVNGKRAEKLLQKEIESVKLAEEIGELL